MSSETMRKMRLAAELVRTHPTVRANPPRFFARLAAWRVLTAYGKDATVRLEPFDVDFWCPSEWRGMSKMAYTMRGCCEPEMPELHRWVRRGATVLDIGAHYGSYSIAMASLVGPSGRVVSFEPSAHAREVLNRNIEINRLTNVEVMRVGLGAEATSAALHLHGDPSRASLNQFLDGDAGAEAIQLARLDDVVDPDLPVSFIKIDIEGYELPAFQGGARLIERFRPTVQFEVQPAAAERAGYPAFGPWDFLADRGYRFVQLMPNRTYASVEAPELVVTPNVMALPD